jgi:hypothetical protein
MTAAHLVIATLVAASGGLTAVAAIRVGWDYRCRCLYH